MIEAKLSKSMRQKEKELVLYCDGSCEGKGSAAVGHYAYVLYHGMEKLLEGQGAVGEGSEMTSTVAEYAAVLRGLEAMQAAGYRGRQVRVRSRRLLPWWRAVRSVVEAFDLHFEWVPRQWNRDADGLLRARR